VGVLARGVTDEGPLRAEWLFTNRRGGHSSAPYDSLNVGGSVGDDPDAVLANRAEVARLIGADRIALVRQVHGRDVAVVSAVPDPPPDADAVITDVPGLPVGTQVADCVPILLADLRGARVAAVHAGWRGVAADVIGAAIERLNPSGPVRAWVGPAICPRCYEVSAEVRDEVGAMVPEGAASTDRGTPAVDLRAGVLAQLRRHGIAGTLVGGCTYESSDLYSFRRDQVTGRQMGVIVLREAEGVRT
jgi:polyphenol oxidase